MRGDAVLKILLASLLISGIHVGNATGWSRLSADEIRFVGAFDAASYTGYTEMAKDGFSRVRVTSEGGNPNIALLIATDIQSRGAVVVVQDYCLSACANYIFFAAKRPVVSCGAVLAWHGTPNYLSDEDELRANGFPDEMIEEMRHWQADFNRREQALLSRSGVRYEFLEYSGQVEEWGGRKPVFNKYRFDPLTGDTSYSMEAISWFPTTKALRKYGVDTSAFCPGYDQAIDHNMTRIGVKGVVTNGD